MDRQLAKKMRDFLNVVIEQAEKDEEFANKLSEVFVGTTKKSEKTEGAGRGANRRDAAVLDPIKLIEEGNESLHQQLESLTEKQLKDIIADFGMDPSKLAMKWKDKDRLIKHIIETSERRASKGDAFRHKGD